MVRSEPMPGDARRYTGPEPPGAGSGTVEVAAVAGAAVAEAAVGGAVVGPAATAAGAVRPSVGTEEASTEAVRGVTPETCFAPWTRLEPQAAATSASANAVVAQTDSRAGWRTSDVIH